MAACKLVMVKAQSNVLPARSKVGQCLSLAPLIPAKIVKVLESSNVESVKAKAPYSKNVTSISINDELVLIPFENHKRLALGFI